MSNILHDLKAFEVSLVPKGANQKKFIIYKSEDGEEEMDGILKELLEKDLENEEQVDEILKEKKLTKEATAAVKSALKILGAYKSEMPEGIMGNLANLLGLTMEDKAKKEDNPGPGTKTKKEDTTGTKEGENGENGQKGGATVMQKEDISKLDLPEEVKKTLAILWKQNEDISKQNELLNQQIQKAQEQKELEKYEQVAKGFKNVSVNPKEFAPILKTIAEKSGEDAVNKVMEVLKGADTALKKSGLFTEIGKTSGGAVSTWDKIEQAAKTVVTKENISKEEAITRAIEQNPELYSEYLRERGEL